MGTLKISLHASGVWVLSATGQSGVVFEGGNRRAKKWKRPPVDALGITRGPSILVPHTSLAAKPRSLQDDVEGVRWLQAPGEGEAVEITLYFGEDGSRLLWSQDQVVIEEGRLKSGSRVFLVSRTRPLPLSVSRDVEQFMKKATLQTVGLSKAVRAQLLWCRESGDSLRTPFIFDLPVPVIGVDGAA
jgi:hypothetical protein